MNSFRISTPRPLGISLNVSRLPVEKWWYGCFGLERDLSSCERRQLSDCKFFLFSESTACSSRSKVEDRNSGAMKNWANRSNAPYRGGSVTSL